MRFNGYMTTTASDHLLTLIYAQRANAGQCVAVIAYSESVRADRVDLALVKLSAESVSRLGVNIDSVATSPEDAHMFGKKTALEFAEFEHLEPHQWQSAGLQVIVHREGLRWSHPLPRAAEYHEVVRGMLRHPAWNAAMAAQYLDDELSTQKSMKGPRARL